MASPSNPLLTLSAISLFTEDLAASKAFYTSVFGAAVVNEDAESCAVKFNNTIINLLVSSAGQELVRPAAVAPPSAGKRFQLTVWVEDLESAMAALREKGVVFLTGPETKPWGLRTVTFEDPAGHSWEVGQDVSKSFEELVG
jgi:catechol 2,3-dioxygenase-like lactoylglutathione lyase family enzyme